IAGARRSNCSFACSAPLSTPTLLRLLGDDLPDARGAHAFVGGDFVIGEALAQASEDAPPPKHHAMRAQPPAPNRRLVLNHQTLLERPIKGKRLIIAYT